MDAISRYVYTALQGGSILKGWTNDDRVMIAGSGDGTRPVIFKIERIDIPESGEEPEWLAKQDCVKICRLLDDAGIDSVEVSGNGTSVRGIRPHKNEGYFVPAAAAAAEAVRCPVIAVGGFRSLDAMEEALNGTKIAYISLSRPLLCEPDLPRKMEKDPETVSKCVSCNACYSSPAHRCIFRRRNGYDD